MVRHAFHRLRCLFVRGGNEDGQGMVEYAFILVLVSITAIVLVAIIGHQTSNSFSNVANAFNP